MVERLAGHRSPTVKPMHVNDRVGSRAADNRLGPWTVAAQAIAALAVQAIAALAAQIASVTGAFRAEVRAAATVLAAVRGASADQAQEPAALAVPPAWAEEEVGGEAAAAGVAEEGEGKEPSLRSSI
jgi:hypothetical protein